MIIRQYPLLIATVILGVLGFQNCSPVNFSEATFTSTCDENTLAISSNHMQDGVTVLRVNQAATFYLENCNHMMADWDMESNGSIEMPNVASVTHTYLAVGEYQISAYPILDDGTRGSAVTHTVRVSNELNNCSVPGTSITIAHNQRKTLYKSVSTCGSNCDPQERLCLNGKFYLPSNTILENPFPSTHLYTSCNSQACLNGCNLRFTDGTATAMTHNEVYPPLAQASSFVYTAVTVPVGQTCNGFKVVCNNGVIKRYATDVVISNPVAKSCCSEQDLNQTLQAMKETRNIKNRVISNSCRDSWLNGYYAGCGAYFDLNEASFMGIKYNGSNSGSSCQILSTKYEAMRVRFVNTCANRYCNQTGADAGMMTASIAISNPNSIVKSHLDQNAVVNCIKQVAPPTAPNACQQIINARKIIETRETTYTVITSKCGQPWDTTLEYFTSCGKTYCQSLNEGFVEGRIIEHGNGKVTTQCFRDQSSYADLFR